MLSRCRLLTRRLFLSLALFATAPLVNATDYTWTGAVSDDWFGAGNWLPVSEFVVPMNNDTATIANGDNVRITQNFTSGLAINGLTLAGGSELSTGGVASPFPSGGYTMFVDNGGAGVTQISGGSTRLVVWEAKAGTSTTGFDTDSMTISSGATVSLVNGRLQVDSGLLYLDNHATIQGVGWIDLTRTASSTFTALDNDGEIVVYPGDLGGAPDELRIKTFDSDGRIDLDGTSENGSVEINNSGTLILDARLRDGFNGVLTMHRNTVIQLEYNWANNSGGTINIEAESGSATIRGGTTPNTFTNRGNISVKSGTLNIDSITNLSGGTITVDGGVHQNEDATVSTPTTVSGSGYWDLDGNSGDTIWNVNDDLTLNVARIESGSGSQDVGSRINLNGSGTTMTVNTSSPWIMGGRLDIDDGAVLAGTAQMNVEGTIVAESGYISSPVAFTAASFLRVTSANSLQLDGPTTYAGGNYRGAVLQQDGVANIAATTVLGANTYAYPNGGGVPTTQDINWLERYDWDGNATTSAETNISPGVTFTINAEEIDGSPSTDGYDGTVNIEGGVLIVNTGTRIPVPVNPPPLPGTILPATVAPTPWRLDGVMNLREVDGNNAVVAAHYGSPLLIYGGVNSLGGTAAITGMAVTLAPSGQIHVASGAELSMNVSGSGSIEVDPGGLFRLTSSSTLQSGVQMDIDGTAELDAHVAIKGGTYTGAGTLRMLGNTDFDETTLLGVYAEFGNGGTNTIVADSELQLASSGSIDSGASFDGSGTVRNLAGSHLNLVSGAQVGVPLVNEGSLTMGASPGIVMVDDFTQISTGVLEIEVKGYALAPQPEYDQLQVAGAATLGGKLEVPILDEFSVNPFNQVNFLTAGSISGEFDAVVAPGLTTHLPGKAFNVIYNTDGAHLVFDSIKTNIVFDEKLNPSRSWFDSIWKDSNTNLPAEPSLLHHITVQNLLAGIQTVRVEDDNALVAKLTVGGGGIDDLILKIGNGTPSLIKGNVYATTDVTLLEKGVIDLYEGTVGTSQLTIDGGELRGNGTVDLSGASTSGLGTLSISNGRISPGHSTGELLVDGDLELIDDGEILFEIVSDTDRDVIDVTGDVGLDGMIILDTTQGGLMPGEKTTIMTASSIDLMSSFNVQADERVFVRVEDVLDLSSVGLSEDDRVALLEDSREELVVDGRIPGDLDGDGYINAGDIPWFAVALKNVKLYQLKLIEEKKWFPSQSKPDYDGNTVVDFDDIDEFAAAMDMQPAQVAHLIALSLQVPEPTTARGFLYLLLTSLLLRRKYGTMLVEFSYV